LIPQNQKGGNKGKELFGFGTTPPINPSNINAGVELLGPNSKSSSNTQGVVRTPRGFQAQDGNRSLAQSGINAALGQAFGREKREQRRVQERVQEVSILGAGRQTIVVRVANLAQGTTAEDVVVSYCFFERYGGRGRERGRCEERRYIIARENDQGRDIEGIQVPANSVDQGSDSAFVKSIGRERRGIVKGKAR
jgi:hypothetical protein